ncbi:MAG: 50S ribosomal protein L25 [Bacillota bacterium]|nr:50S ribosomal protein L25 [Candidatus Fermentithermobacillaceae bacterium]
MTVLAQDVITAKTRDTGTSAAKACRRQGLVPGIVYGKGIEPVPVALSSSEVRRLLSKGMSHIHRLKIEDAGFDDRVMVQSVDRNPLTGEIIHIDLHRISMEEKVRLEVPIALTGEEEIASRGLILQRQAREVTVECLPADIPSHITADVSGMQAGDTLLVGDLAVPEEIRLLTSPEEVVAAVVAPRLAAEEAAEAEETADEGEPEAEAE